MWDELSLAKRRLLWLLLAKRHRSVRLAMRHLRLRLAKRHLLGQLAKRHLCELRLAMRHLRLRLAKRHRRENILRDERLGTIENREPAWSLGPE